MNLNDFICPRCKESGSLPGTVTHFKCQTCGAGLKSNAIVALIGALFLGGLPVIFVGVAGYGGTVIALTASIVLPFVLWRTFLNVRLQKDNENEA